MNLDDLIPAIQGRNWYKQRLRERQAVISGLVALRRRFKG